jgi:hypothetical protein
MVKKRILGYKREDVKGAGKLRKEMFTLLDAA